MRISTLILAVMLVACSTSSITDEGDSLKETAVDLGNTLAAQNWSELYRFYPDRYQAKCSEEHFIDMWEQLVDRVGMPNDLQLVVTGARSEGGLGYLDAHWRIGDRVHSALNGDGVPSFKFANSGWRIYVPEAELAEHRPCDVIIGSDLIEIQTTSGNAP